MHEKKAFKEITTKWPMYKPTLIFILMELTDLKRRYWKRDDPLRREEKHCRKIHMYLILRLLLSSHIETNDDDDDDNEEEEDAGGYTSSCF